ncbi:hypothetical protein [Luteimonas sp. RC10]|uniref:hypothetical protein n=1 Tax=Luteimonas sp. RC10 TaxID=2587035 RepID=UPI0016070EBB|nr:hypothetical protein [Luteimonas sp. RC10]MBB3343917.1 hypothetical protein [Luteimonas sp. RC10]
MPRLRKSTAKENAGMRHVFFAVIGAAALAFMPKIVSAQSVTISCEPSNWCMSEAAGISYDTISWSASHPGVGAIFPANCTNQNFCRFYCPSRPGFVTMTVNYRLGGQLMGSATASTRCTAQDI